MSEEQQIEYVEFRVLIPKAIIDIASYWEVTEKEMEERLKEQYDIDPSFSEITVVKCDCSTCGRIGCCSKQYKGGCKNMRSWIPAVSRQEEKWKQKFSHKELK